MSWKSIIQVIYSFPSCFGSQFDLLERNFCTRYPFVSLFFGSKSKIFGRFGTFLAHIGVLFLNQLPTQFRSNLSIFFPFFWSHWPTEGQTFEVAILFCDFSLGSKRDMLGSFFTFPAHIGGFFLNELANHFRSNLLFFFLCLRSIWPTGELVLRSLSFSLTFFLVQKVTFQAVLAHS